MVPSIWRMKKQTTNDILKVDNNDLDQSFNFFHTLDCTRPKLTTETLEQGVKHVRS